MKKFKYKTLNIFLIKELCAVITRRFVAFWKDFMSKARAEKDTLWAGAGVGAADAV